MLAWTHLTRDLRADSQDLSRKATLTTSARIPNYRTWQLTDLPGDLGGEGLLLDRGENIYPASGELRDNNLGKHGLVAAPSFQVILREQKKERARWSTAPVLLRPFLLEVNIVPLSVTSKVHCHLFQG